ncbi:MAG: hypothetical protein GF390_01755 [Candidatus Pacebacteria bacterium]|nr:hypothetical protein [Candidatus Paceibacterota bacterium]
MNSAFLAYIPVLHHGYQLFFAQHPASKILYLLGENITQQYKPLRKDLRALKPELIKKSLQGWQRFKHIKILTSSTELKNLDPQLKLIMPNEDVMHDLANKYLSQHLKNKQINFAAIFLRWDKHQTQQKQTVQADAEITAEKLAQKMMGLALKQANKSTNWWRHVGAVVAKDGQVLLAAHARHLPSEHQPYLEGDPRNNFSKGLAIELSTSQHAEANLIAQAAKQGLKLANSQMYVTTFPCPVCAKQVASAGIKTVYFYQGYGMLDAEHILKTAGVKIIKVTGDFSKIQKAENKFSHVVKY